MIIIYIQGNKLGENKRGEWKARQKEEKETAEKALI